VCVLTTVESNCGVGLFTVQVLQQDLAVDLISLPVSPETTALTLALRVPKLD